MSIEQPSSEQPEESLRERVSVELKKIIPELFPGIHQDKTKVSETSQSTKISGKMINSAVEKPEKTEVAK
jgi:hypothetical protein